jgi:hypothetical protein
MEKSEKRVGAYSSLVRGGVPLVKSQESKRCN